MPGPRQTIPLSHLELLEQMRQATRQAAPDGNVMVAFSGGVDSALLARLCADEGRHVTLLTVGFEDSHDVSFAKKMAQITHHEHRVLHIRDDELISTVSRIRSRLRNDSASWLENCIAFCYIARLAGDSPVLTANGIDELFCGYDIYRREFDSGRLMQIMDQKIQNELEMLEAIGDIASVQTIQPFLRPEFVRYAKTIPLHEKVTGSDDVLRKHIVRRAALHAGVPRISAYKRKKALQYGSGIHKAVLRI